MPQPAAVCPGASGRAAPGAARLPQPLRNRQDSPPLKLHASGPTSINTFTGYGDDYVAVNGRRIERSVVVLPDRILADWEAGSLEELTAAHLEALVALEREVILLGTGSRLRFPPASVLRPAMARLAAAGTGLEVMDVHAACRTYNILVAEERRVAAALLLR